MKNKGFIFDLDGVIVDTAKYHYLAWKKLAESIGISFSEVQNEQLKGVSRVGSLEKILAWQNTKISQDKFMELMEQKNKDYLSHVSRMTENEILPDVVRVISYLKKHEQPIALGSASKNAKAILEKVNLLNEFDIVVDGNNVSKTKPNPEVFLISAKRLRKEPKNCIVFEDAVAGVQAANKAGMISIGIGSEEVLYEADYTFNNFTEISNKFLEELIYK